jgi:hypothetical protein
MKIFDGILMGITLLLLIPLGIVAGIVLLFADRRGMI